EGGWLTVLATSALIALCMAIRRHYAGVFARLKRLDQILGALPSQAVAKRSLDPKKPTAVMLVGGYSGLGIHSLLTVLKLFPRDFLRRKADLRAGALVRPLPAQRDRLRHAAAASVRRLADGGAARPGPRVSARHTAGVLKRPRNRPGGIMGKTVIDGLQGLRSLAGKQIGVSDWRQMTYEAIRKFADATGDHQWIHVDRERIARESPFGKPIAHGYFTVSLIAGIFFELVEIKNFG